MGRRGPPREANQDTTGVWLSNRAGGGRTGTAEGWFVGTHRSGQPAVSAVRDYLYTSQCYGVFGFILTIASAYYYVRTSLFSHTNHGEEGEQGE